MADISTEKTLTSVLDKIKDLHKTTEELQESQQKSVPLVENTTEAIKEGTAVAENSLEIARSAEVKSLGVWGDMKATLDKMGQDSGAASVSRALTEQHLGALKSSMSLAELAERDQTVALMESIDRWMDDNEMSLDKLDQSFRDGSKESIDSITMALADQMTQSGMHQGQIFDELLNMNAELAESFENQLSFDVARWREEKEALDEANRKKKDRLEGKDATDKSLDLTSPIGIMAAIAGFITGFFEGFFGPIKTMIAKPLDFAWKGFKSFLKDSAIGKWYANVKAWFTTAQVDAKTGKFAPSKWTNFKTMLKDNAITKFYKSVKGWFAAGDMGKEWKNIKSFFSGKGGIKLPTWLSKTFSAIRAAKNGVFAFFRSVGRIFGKLFFWIQIIMAVFDFWTGFTESKHTGLAAIWDGFGLALKNFFGGFLDLGIMLEDAIKWIIKKIAGFFGFDEAAVGAAIEGFSIFKPIKKALNTVIDWLVLLLQNPLAAMEGLFAGIATVGQWIYDKALKPVWDWFEGMFPDAAAAIKPFFQGIANLGTWIYDNALKPFWTWFKSIFSNPLGAIEGYFGFLADIGQWIYDTALKPMWDWFEGMFPDAAASIKPLFAAIANIGTWIYDNAIKPFWTWFKSIFSDPMGALMALWGAVTSFGTWIYNNAIKPVWDFITGIFTDPGATLSALFTAVASFGTWIYNKAIKPVWDFISGIFSNPLAILSALWGAIASIGTWVYNNAIKPIWDWFAGIFGFGDDDKPEDDRSLLAKLGGLLGDVWTWFTGIFGFGDDDKPKDERSLLSKLTGMIGDVWTWISDWFKGLWGGDSKPGEQSIWDKIGSALSDAWTAIKGVFDIDWGASLQSLAKSVMPGWMYDWFYDDAPPSPEAEKQPEKPSPTAAKPPSAVLTEADVDKIMNAVDFRMFDFGSIFGYDLNFGESLKDTLTTTMKGGIPGIAIQKAASGALVGMKMPSDNPLGLEDGGLFTLSAGEMVLDNQAAQTFLAAAQLLTGTNINPTGADLAALQRETNEISGAGSAPIIVNNAPTNVMNENSQPLVLPTPALAPGNGGAHLER